MSHSAAVKALALRSALQNGVRAVAAPSLFETPEQLAEVIMDRAGLTPGHRVLEPSAGLGRLARAALRRTGCSVQCVEVNPQLCTQLAGQGHEVVCADFATLQPDELGRFDRIVMNPPFERGQDRDHVRHAIGFLKPGGRLVAIMSEGPFFRERRADRAFRDWLDALDADAQRLPADTFCAAGTSVQTRLVVLEGLPWWCLSAP